MLDYSKRLAEVDEVLNHLDKKYLDKIPIDVRQAIISQKDPEHLWKYDTTKALKEQNLSRDTIIILTYLNKEYLLDDEERKKLEKILESNEQKYNATLPDYNFDEIFKDMSEPKETNETSCEEGILEVRQSESLFKKILNGIKKIFK